MPNMVVSGAGDNRANGTYTENGTHNGKPRYTKAGTPQLDIVWNYFWGTGANAWIIGSHFTDPPMDVYYVALSDVTTPDLAPNWASSWDWDDNTPWGYPPVPTITAEGGEPEPEEYTLECNAGSYSLTGSPVTLTLSIRQNLTLSCEAGSYSLTGTNADLTVQRNYVLECGAGSYSLTGTNATLTHTPASQNLTLHFLHYARLRSN